MKLKNLNISEAFEAGEKMTYMMSRTLSSVYLGMNSKREKTDEFLSELEEIRFFNEKTEIKILRKENNLVAIQTEEEPSDNCLVKIYPIANPEFGKTLQISYNLSQDEDGQTYISDERFSGWEGI